MGVIITAERRFPHLGSKGIDSDERTSRCGIAVNPDVVLAQMENAIRFGMTAVLHGKIELEDGAVKESIFHDYPIGNQV